MACGGGARSLRSIRHGMSGDRHRALTAAGEAERVLRRTEVVLFSRLGRWAGYAAALTAVALVSGLIGLVLREVTIANISMLYLMAVLAAAVRFGRGPAVLAAVLAFVVFDWFFVAPSHTFTVSDPEEWVSLLLFLLTAMIAGQLAADQRRRAQEAGQREREALVLYDLVRLLAGPDLQRAVRAMAERLRVELNLAGVGIDCSGAQGPNTRAEVGDEDALTILRSTGTRARHLLGEGHAPTASARGTPGRWVRLLPPGLPDGKVARNGGRLRVVPVKTGAGQRVGSLFLVQRPDTPPLDATADRLLSAAAAQLGQAVERADLRHEATEAEILRRTDELKTALLHAVSHDLRTPLASIVASGGSLLQQDVAWTEDERRAFARDIVDEAGRLNRIVGNLLDLSRIEAGTLQPDLGWYDLAALVDDVLGRLHPLTARHQMIATVPDDLPPVLIDYVQIDQVLTNLVENAVKYTPPGTPIEVRAWEREGMLHVAVEDRGPGIPARALPHVFDRFYRVEGTGLRPRGTGVGLAVVKGLVEAHRGRIWAENRPGGGARFELTLPMEKTPTAEEHS